MQEKNFLVLFETRFGSNSMEKSYLFWMKQFVFYYYYIR